MEFSFWIFIGSIYLLFLSYKDIKNQGWVDERHNYFMSGLTLSMLFLVNSTIWYLLTLTLVVTILFITLKKLDVVGEADVQSISWIILGFGLLGINLLMWWFIFFALLTILYFVLRKFLERLTKARYEVVPFFPVIALSFILVCLMFGLYI